MRWDYGIAKYDLKIVQQNELKNNRLNPHTFPPNLFINPDTQTIKSLTRLHR